MNQELVFQLRMSVIISCLNLYMENENAKTNKRSMIIVHASTREHIY
jgi:hypothetical protein